MLKPNKTIQDFNQPIGVLWANHNRKIKIKDKNIVEPDSIVEQSNIAFIAK